MKLDSNGFPRRRNTKLLTPIEKLLRQTMLAVERMPASPLLTDASTLISQAREKVADFIESQEPVAPPDGPRRQFMFFDGDTTYHVGSEDDMD